MTARVNPAALRGMLGGGGELALVDVREELIFSQRHLLLARSVPLSRFELKFAQLVPRRTTPIVLCDDGDGRAERAAAILSRNGYADVSILAGGVDAWAAAGFELFSGVNVPSKAFGEYVEHAKRHAEHRRRRAREALARRRRLGRARQPAVRRICRASRFRPRRMCPARNWCCARAKLRRRRETMVVVNCAGRTRSIIGAQSLINAGLPNKVVALRNGTMGWSLAGFRCDKGKNRRAPPVSPRRWSGRESAAQRVAQSCGVERIDGKTLDAWRADAGRTLYVFDVRDPAEYEAGHLPGAISAPGGQLVQATDQYVGTLGARIVLVDDAEVRAAMTASWLRQMGWRDVFILTEKGTETGWPATPALDADTRSGDAINCKAAQ